MLIKPITAQDLKNMDTHLGSLFFDEVSLPGHFKPNVFKTNWVHLLEANVGVMFGAYKEGKLVGALGGLLFPEPNSGDLVASETFWYVHPDERGGFTGIRLLNTFMEWAKSIGANRVIMAHLVNSMPDKLKTFYEKKGFKETEVHYVKEL